MGILTPGLSGVTGLQNQPTGQFIEGSLRFNGVNQHLTKTFSSGDRRTFTLSYWVKEHGKGSSPTNNPHVLWSGTAVETRGGMVHRGTAGTDSGRIYMFNQVSNSTDSAVWTNSKHRDFSAWKHVVFRVDSTISSPSTARVRIYINGVEQDAEYKTTPGHNHQFQININQEHRIGRGIPDDYGNFSLSQYYFIDAQALGPEYFGFTDPLTNTWRPKKYEGTFGTTGFWLPFDGISPIGKDKSGNGNDWSPQNFSDSDILKDSPSGAAFSGAPTSGITTTSSAPSNYCTWNPIDNINVELSEGNLKCTDSGGNYDTVFGTHTSVDGKHYFEVTVTALTTTMAVGVYVGNNRNGIDGSNYPYDANAYMTHKNGLVYHDGSTYSYQSAYGAGDTVGVAIDSENRKAWVSVNGSYVAGDNPATGTGGMQSISGVGAMPDGELYPAIMIRSATTEANFGQKPFKYAPPEGFLPLNSANARPETVITRPDQYVGIATHNGSGGTQCINVHMKPDFVWIKSRTGSTAYEHLLFDTVRGATKYIKSNSTAQEQTNASTLSSFNSNGFTLGGDNEVNRSAHTYVSWCWRAGGNKNTFSVDDVGYASAAAAGLTAGTIAPAGASVGTKQGFSIIKYTGTGSAATLPHGLSESPEFLLVKNLANTYNWAVYHKDLTSAAYYLFLNNTDGESNNYYTFWNSTDPSSTVISLGADSSGTNVNANQASQSHVCYAWHSVPGLQKFGKYVGNASSDGPFIETGMRPALVMFKKIGESGDVWLVYDATRDTENPTAKRLFWSANNNEQESDDYAIDILSNGFKIRTSDGSWNKSGFTYIYAAWAEAPASNLFGGQSNAR